MITIIKGAHIYGPEDLGIQDLLLASGKICAVQKEISWNSNIKAQIIDGTGLYLFPGFIDCHVHITGGGGEGGFLTRTPPIQLTDITLGGVTTVIGTLGTDGTTRSMADLLAKAYALEEEGITTYIQSGSYQLPLQTLTGSLQNDIVLIDKIIGAGELAIADHRSSHPTVDELARIASHVRVGAMLSGKAGIINLHMGDSLQMLSLLEKVLAQTDIPMRHFVPTHMNRNPYLFEKGLEYCAKGGFIDFTTSTVPAFLDDGEISAYHTLKIMLEKGLSIDGVTFSSDGQGSLPIFDEKGEICSLDVGKVTSLYEAVADAIKKDHIPIPLALSVITANPANIYRLPSKGYVKENYDADLVLVNPQTLSIHTVFAKGIVMVENGKAVRKGAYGG